MPLIESVRTSDWFQMGSVDADKDRRNISGIEQKAHKGQILRDGFQQLFHSQEHVLPVRGFGWFIQKEEFNENKKNTSSPSGWRKEYFFSYDSKHLQLWQHNKLVKSMKFHSSEPNYLGAIIYIQKLNVFLATTSDMKFNLYDKNLLLVESIKHEERTIVSMQQNYETGLIVTAGANGLSVWRAYRNTNLDMSHVMEKMFAFEGIPKWINRVIFDVSNDRKLFAILDRSVYVCDINWRSATLYLKNVHDAPVTACVWYARSQFYITGCNAGLIKCYSSIYKDIGRGGSNDEKLGSYVDGTREMAPTSLALLHTFSAHTKAVTGLELHPVVPGLLITTSLDGTVRVLNLEALNELFSVRLSSPITGLKLFIRRDYKGFALSQQDGSVRLWKITSVCDFFATATSDVSQVELVENLQVRPDGRVRNWTDRPVVDLKALHPKGHSLTMPELTNALRDTNVKHELEQSEQHDERRKHEHQALIQRRAAMRLSYSKKQVSKRVGEDLTESSDEEELLTPHEFRGLNFAYISFSNQDLRILTDTGVTVSRLEPSAIVEGVRSYSVSLYQEMLFCSMETPSPVIKIYSICQMKCPLLRTVTPCLSDQDYCSCITLINVSPITDPSIIKSSRSPDAKDFRGNLCPLGIEEVLVLGMHNGSLIFLDTFSNLDVIQIFQAQVGPLDSMVYRPTRMDLFTFGLDTATHAALVKVWRLPSMRHVCSHSGITHASCWAVSQSLNFFAYGLMEGSLKLYSFLDELQDHLPVFLEICQSGQHHDGTITAITFCEEHRIIFTCASDTSIMCWNYQKNYLKTIIFNNPMKSLAILNIEGDCLISQRNYILVVRRAVWDNGEVEAAKNIQDPWTYDAVGDDKYDEEDVKFLKNNSKPVGSKQQNNMQREVTFITNTQALDPFALKEEQELPLLSEGLTRKENFSMTDYLRHRLQEEKTFSFSRPYNTRCPRFLKSSRICANDEEILFESLNLVGLTGSEYQVLLATGPIDVDTIKARRFQRPDHSTYDRKTWRSRAKNANNNVFTTNTRSGTMTAAPPPYRISSMSCGLRQIRQKYHGAVKSQSIVSPRRTSKPSQILAVNSLGRQEEEEDGEKQEEVFESEPN